MQHKAWETLNTFFLERACVCLCLLPHMRIRPVSSNVSLAVSSMVNTMLSTALN